MSTLRGLLLQGKLALRGILVPGARIRGSQVVVSGWILRLKLYRFFERSDRVAILLLAEQSHPQPEVRVAEIRIERAGFREVLNRRRKVLHLTRQFARDVFRPGVRRINFEFLLQFLLRLLLKVSRRIRTRQQQPSQPEVNAGISRIL